MSLVGIFGLLLALAAVFVADLRRDRRRIAVFALLLVLHTAMCLLFYVFAEASGSDAQFYYYDPGRWRGASGFGTVFLVNLIQFLRDSFGGSFLDYFMIFNAIGFWGLVMMMLVMQETFADLDLRVPTLAYLTLFLPGLHFWTGFIGKDAPLFFAIALSIWAAMRIQRRYLAFGIAVAIMLLFRPHIALVALVAVAAAVILDKRTKLILKAGMIAGALAAGAIAIPDLQTTYRLDLGNADSVSEFVAERSAVTEESGGDAMLMNAGLPFKILSLWSRPFFFDADAMLAYAASVENAALLAIMALILFSFRSTWAAFRMVLHVRYSAFLFVAITLLIAAVNFNVGLGLRQKMMAMPALLAIFSAVLAVRMARARHAAALEQAALRAPARPSFSPSALGPPQLRHP